MRERDRQSVSEFLRFFLLWRRSTSRGYFSFRVCERELVSSCETETERVQGVSSGRQDTHQRRQSEREEEGEREWYVRGTKSGRGVT